MTHTNLTPTEGSTAAGPVQSPIQWTDQKALLLCAVCLIVGVAGGWSIRGLQAASLAGAATASMANPAQQATNPASQPSNPLQLKAMADAKATPLLAQLKADPDNPDLLISIGNLYYDAQQYQVAIDNYGRALKIKPSDASARTDMATAYWYLGNADVAIAEFNKALDYAPDNSNTLFNRGLVKWHGKKDAVGAVTDWQRLLATNPNYQEKDKVRQMIADAAKDAGVTPK